MSLASVGMAYSVVIDSDVIHCARRVVTVFCDGDGLVDMPGMVNIVDVVRVICVARYLAPAEGIVILAMIKN